MSQSHRLLHLGANPLHPGTCQFRVWAPYRQHVSVRLVDQDRSVSLNAEDHGYFSAVVDHVHPGDRYLFDLGADLIRPDPASRSQPEGVHGPSVVVDSDFDWNDSHWHGIPLRDYVIYELHVGTFTPEGTFDAAIASLNRLVDLGITAIEIMPVAQYPGDRNWGYDGAYLFAVQNSYGGPDGLKRFVNACHARGLAVVLDVVYNHFGPEGNYIRDFGPYFTTQYRTPWGDALNFDGPGSDEVRAFFLSNALYWQTEFHIDALRLDAVHAIKDFSALPFLRELAQLCHKESKRVGRPFHLIAESDMNDSRLLHASREGGYGLDAIWADDYHHACHALLTGETNAYYRDYGKLEHLAAAYRSGFTYSGQYSNHRGRRHGNSPDGLEPWRFVVCVQNHDQVGNRAFGGRLSSLCDWESLKLAAGLLTLSPFLPLIFMGEEYAEPAPFQYFVSHSDADLVEAVRHGRRREFSGFFTYEDVPDPQDLSSFERSKLDQTLANEGRHAVMHGLYKSLLRMRREHSPLRIEASFPPQVVAHDTRPILEVVRHAEGQSAWIAFHFGSMPVSVNLPASHQGWERLIDSSDARWDGPGAQSTQTVSPGSARAIQLNPHSFVVYKQSSSYSGNSSS